jgi:hypothetical protein
MRSKAPLSSVLAMLVSPCLLAPPGPALADDAARSAPSPGLVALEAAAEALADFRPEDAVPLLERAKDEGPFRHADHLRLYEQLGVAHAYLEQKREALEAFRMLLALDPGHAISYTLSPKVTFLFEEARKRATEAPLPEVDLGWPRGLTVDQPVPVEVEVLADPERFLARGELHYRLRGAPRYLVLSFPLPRAGEPPARVELPALAAGATRSEVVELHLVALDAVGNEVLVFGSEKRPREIALGYAPTEAWYGRWWVWALVGAAVAASATAVAVGTASDPAPTIGGSFRVLR